MKVVNIEHRHGHIKKNNLENEKYFKDSFHFIDSVPQMIRSSCNSNPTSGSKNKLKNVQKYVAQNYLRTSMKEEPKIYLAESHRSQSQNQKNNFQNEGSNDKLLSLMMSNYTSKSKDEQSPKRNEQEIKKSLLYSQIHSLLYSKCKSPQILKQRNTIQPTEKLISSQIQKRNSILLREKDETGTRRNTTQNTRKSMKEYSMKNIYAMIMNQSDTKHKANVEQNDNSNTSILTKKFATIMQEKKKKKNFSQTNNYFSQPSDSQYKSQNNSETKKEMILNLSLTNQGSNNLHIIMNRIKVLLNQHQIEKNQWKKERDMLLNRIAELEQNQLEQAQLQEIQNQQIEENDLIDQSFG